MLRRIFIPATICCTLGIATALAWAQSASAPAGQAMPGATQTLARFIAPLGAATFILVLSAVASAIFRKVKPRTMLKLHKLLGAAALVVGACHGLIVLLSD